MQLRVPGTRQHIRSANKLEGGRSIVSSDCEMERVDLARFRSIWEDTGNMLGWDCPFVLPPWIEAWSETLGRAAEPLCIAATAQGSVVGVAPFMLQDDRALFWGDPDLFDYFDCVVGEGFEARFVDGLLEYLSSSGVREVDLWPVRGDSLVATHFPARAVAGGFTTTFLEVGSSYEVDLPSSWDNFLLQLSGKQRHEVRRKLRRLGEAGEVALHCVSDSAAVERSMPVFLDLFAKNREDKATFMGQTMADFFRRLAGSLATVGLLRLCFVHLDGEPVASTFCFDHLSKRYLYNNGYDERFARLSVSLLSKILALRDAIGAGLAVYDFLKGDEPYKERLGGHEVPLYRLRVALGT